MPRSGRTYRRGGQPRIRGGWCLQRQKWIITSKLPKAREYGAANQKPDISLT
jgi:hypothetical protein